MEIKTLYHKLFSGTLDNADIGKLIQHIKTHGIALRDYDEKLTRLIYNGNPSEYISSNPLTTYLSVCFDIYIVDDKNHVICVSKNKKLHNANIYNTIPFNMLIKPNSDSHIKTEFKYIHLGMDVSKNAYDLLKIYFDSQNIIKQ